MIHLYKRRKYDNWKFFAAQALCLNAWVSWNEPGYDWTSVGHKVTCPKCLDILIPPAEQKLKIMKENREKNK